MLEKDIQRKFATDWHENLEKALKLDNLRLYAFEFPVRTPDGEKRADLVYEVMLDEPMKNPMFVIELKKDKIDTGVCEQVRRYSYYIQKQLYRKKDVKSIIASPDFSRWELDECRKNDIYALQFDLKGNMHFVA